MGFRHWLAIRLFVVVAFLTIGIAVQFSSSWMAGTGLGGVIIGLAVAQIVLTAMRVNQGIKKISYRFPADTKAFDASELRLRNDTLVMGLKNYGKEIRGPEGVTIGPGTVVELQMPVGEDPKFVVC